MPSSSSVHEQLTDILVQVVGCRADAVTPEASLKELGIDSLLIVEVGEELGRRFDVYLSDDTIDALVTVQDAIDAVVRHDGSQPPGDAPRVPTLAEVTPPPNDEVSRVTPDDSERRGNAVWFGTRFALAGLVIGAVLGIGGAALMSASGLGAADLPSIATPTTAEPTPTPTPEPEPTPSSATSEPKPEIDASSERVSPGERFFLSGVFPGLDEGEQLQVEVRDVGQGQDWDEFPIKTSVRDGGTFRAELYTSRTGGREFRVKVIDSGKTTPSVTVEIG